MGPQWPISPISLYMPMRPKRASLAQAWPCLTIDSPRLPFFGTLPFFMPFGGMVEKKHYLCSIFILYKVGSKNPPCQTKD